MKIIVRFASLVVALFPFLAFSQTVQDADMGANLNIRVDTKTGEIESCGFEIHGAHVINADKGLARTFSTSLIITSSGYGTGKITGTYGNILTPNFEGMKDAQVYGGWFRSPGKRAAVAISEFINGESEGSKLFVADTGSTMETLTAIAGGELLQVAISWEEGKTVVYQGTPTISETHVEQFSQCVSDLILAIERGMSAGPSK
ncbi:hypothetical protein [Kerstersia gyiorum]|uniref:hypothetical protein n=1 Tax=Kerstersia gyiorum TaxID=206506 RepID=UPI00209CADAB|nr:hypothetical protein [Kerstersia gyiorum]MCP1679436.1 hypothetical protein [Kerstersia gyiorum]MCP1823939.1 hypothetical protein [Kerstersia gyiorum]MCP1827380.1 hypothetical protein [Kerstersia gyiorum]MCW2448971.1 hypothetical protein [Kerstersia gyiorum]